jgi:hypothetical protein
MAKVTFLIVCNTIDARSISSEAFVEDDTKELEVTKPSSEVLIATSVSMLPG